MTIKPFLFLLLVCAATATNAQTGNAEIGIEAGAGVRHISSNHVKYDATGGYSFGVSFQYKLTTLLSLRTNLHMERKGAVISGIYITDEQGSPLGQTNMSIDLDYLTLPVLLRYSVGRSVKFFMNAGPYCGMLLRESMLVEKPRKRVEGNPNASYKNIDFGLALGMGGVFPIGEKLGVSVEARYNMGLLNVFNGRHLEWSNQTAIVLLGLSYKL